MTNCAVFWICFAVSFTISFITGIIVKIKTENKIFNEYDKKLNQSKSYNNLTNDDKDFPGLLSCPSCNNVKITL